MNSEALEYRRNEGLAAKRTIPARFCAFQSGGSMSKTILAGVVLAALAAAQNPHMISRSGGKVKQSLAFDGKTYVLKFVDQTRIVDLNEYYLQNEQPENWTQLVSVSVYKTPLTPGAMAKNM